MPVLFLFKTLLLLAVVALRFAAIASLATVYLGDGGPYARAALAYDARWIALCAALVLLGGLMPRRWLAGMAHWTVSALVAIGALDVYVFQATWQRLSWSNFISFGGEWSAAFDFFLKNLHKPDAAAYSVLLVVALLWLVLEPVLLMRLLRPVRAPGAVRAALAMPLLLLPAMVPVQLLDSAALGTFKPLSVDVLTYQWAYSGAAPVRPASRAAFEQRYAERASSHQACAMGLGRRGDVVLVIMESLSSHQSQRVAGLRNWTPRIDEIFADGWTFRNFHANGFRTDLGLVAVLAGLDPVAGDATGVSVYQNAGGSGSLPARLLRRGYATHFISGSSLFFLDADQWLPGLGFEYLHGPQPAPGETRKSYIFQSWPDRQTYDTALQIMAKASRPGLFVVNTMSSHMPYRNPETGQLGEQAAMEYADQAFAGFYHQLEQRGFFRQGGLLVLTGDHRSMTPVSVQERQRYGASAAARVPLFVLAEGLPSMPALQDAPFQQTDLPPSLEYWAGDGACFQQRQRNIFHGSGRGAGRCIIHVRGDNQRYLSFFCGEEVVEVEMNDTGARVVQGAAPTGLADALDDLVARRLGIDVH